MMVQLFLDSSIVQNRESSPSIVKITKNRVYELLILVKIKAFGQLPAASANCLWIVFLPARNNQFDLLSSPGINLTF